MHKSAVSLSEDGGDTKGKEAIIEVLVNNLGRTFTMMGVVLLLNMVSIVGIMLDGSLGTCGSW